MTAKGFEVDKNEEKIISYRSLCGCAYHLLECGLPLCVASDQQYFDTGAADRGSPKMVSRKA